MGNLLIVVGILAVLFDRRILGDVGLQRAVRTRNAKDNNYSQIGIQLTRKYDLIPEPGEVGQGIHEA